MDTIPISKFKATCLAELERVRATGRPLRVTRFGKPVADIVPVERSAPPRRRLGALVGTATITADLTEPTTALADWEVLTE